jgi:hypothetical protein
LSAGARLDAAVQVAKLAAIRGLRAYYDGSVKVVRPGASNEVLMEFPEWSDALEYFQRPPGAESPLPKSDPGR